MDDALQIGKWLEFDAGTCFGTRKKHFGILVGIDYEREVAVVAVNATSRLESLIRFADFNGIPVEDAMVDVTEDVHFSKPTGIDCHRPKEIPLEILKEWVELHKVRLATYNEDVPRNKMVRIFEVIERSPLVESSIKAIVGASAARYVED